MRRDPPTFLYRLGPALRAALAVEKRQHRARHLGCEKSEYPAFRRDHWAVGHPSVRVTCKRDFSSSAAGLTWRFRAWPGFSKETCYPCTQQRSAITKQAPDRKLTEAN